MITYIAPVRDMQFVIRELAGLEQLPLRPGRRLQSGEPKAFYRAKIATATFYAEPIMPKANALLSVVKSGASTALTLAEECF